MTEQHDSHGTPSGYGAGEPMTPIPGFEHLVEANMVIGQQQTSNQERQRIAARLGTFNAKDNEPWKEITQRFGANIKQPELLSIANVLSQSANVKLDRDAKRRKKVLIKWFDENWDAIKPFLDYIVLEDNNSPKNGN